MVGARCAGALCGAPQENVRALHHFPRTFVASTEAEKMLAALEATEAHLTKLERLLERILKRIPIGVA